MRTEIEVYLGDEQLEFSEPLDILFNYKITDSTNPTAIRNSFSKGIKIAGTPKNNDIFGNIWDLNRIQGYEGIINTGFNAQKKTPFTIYVDGNIYESGYAKLDSITKKNNQISYNLTLFGGIGELFFALTYKDEDGVDKRTLADLQYEERGDDDSLTEVIDMDFTINKETIWDAWNQIMGNPDAVYDEMETDRPNNYYNQYKWNFINFMPAYEGIPADFSPSKVLLNKRGADSIIVENNGFTASNNGYCLGECSEELTCNYTKDYRSYLQRPVIRMKEIIKACQNPINNGGWELKLDKTFFNKNNPYWEDTWLTLDLLTNNIEGGEEYIETNVEINPSSKSNYYDIDVDTTTLSEFSNVNLGLGIIWNNTTTTTANKLYLSYYYDGPDGWTTEKTNYYKYNSAILLQLIGYNAVGEVVLTSNVQYLYSPDSGLGTNWGGYKSNFSFDGVPINGVDYHTGCFFKDSDGKYIWTNNPSKPTPTAIKFNFTEKNNITSLKLKVVNPYDVSYKTTSLLSSSKSNYGGGNSGVAFANPKIVTSSKESTTEAFNRSGKVSGKVGFEVADANLVITDYPKMYSGTKIRKADYLTTEHTACDYLIAYAKMFGLYFWRDFNATPKDDSYNKGVIYLLTRNSFYDKENIIDIQDIVDRSRDMVITPSTADSKWLMFNTEQVESEVEEEYFKEFGSEYGSKLINTGFNFNGDTKNLLDKAVFKGGVEVLEESKYFAPGRQYLYNGFTYQTYKYNGGEVTIQENEIPIQPLSTASININGWVRTDAFPKLQFHTTKNDPTDGRDVLVFYKPARENEDLDNYWISDDIPDMTALNDGEACWLYTETEEDMMGNKIAYNIQSLPQFGRNLINPSTNKITHSLDMGNPKMVFIRDVFNSNKQSIYDKCWKPFIEDMYDDDNRLLSCYVRFDNKPVSSQLRNLYWFDNSIWRLNTIKDWNITKIEPIRCEFVKVMDLNNYYTAPITQKSSFIFDFPALKEVNRVNWENGATDIYYEIGSEAQTIVGRIETEGVWSFPAQENDGFITLDYEDGSFSYLDLKEVMTPSTLYGVGDTIKEFRIPINNVGINRSFNLRVEGDDNIVYDCYFYQPSTLKKNITINPPSVSFTHNANYEFVEVTINNGDEKDALKLSAFVNNTLSSWVSLVKVGTDGNKAIFRIDVENNDLYQRTAIINFILGTETTAKLFVTQSGNMLPSFSVNQEFWLFAGIGGTGTIEIMTNADSWEIKGYPDWITIIDPSPNLNSYEFSVEPNRKTTRSGEILISWWAGDDNYTQSIVINQGMIVHSGPGFEIEDLEK